MNGNSAVLTFDLEPSERKRLGRLGGEIIEAIAEDGGNPIELCGAFVVRDRRMIQLFGRVSIPSIEFLTASDAEVLAFIRSRIRINAGKQNTLTDVMDCLSAEQK